MPWAKFPKFQVGGGRGRAAYVGALKAVVGDVGTPASTSETVLASASLPAKSLARDGQAIRVRAWGRDAANANAGTTRLRVGPTTLTGTAIASIAKGNASLWSIEAYILRKQAAVQRTSVHSRTGAAATPTGTVQGNTQLTVDENANNLIELTGQNGVATASDIVLEGFLVEAVAQ